jgi:hypothetical protein
MKHLGCSPVMEKNIFIKSLHEYNRINKFYFKKQFSEALKIYKFITI